MNLSLGSRIYVNGSVRRGYGTIVGMAIAPGRYLTAQTEKNLGKRFGAKTDQPYPQIFVRMEGGGGALMHYNATDFAAGKILENAPVVAPAPAPVTVVAGNHTLDFGTIPTGTNDGIVGTGTDDMCDCPNGVCILGSRWFGNVSVDDGAMVISIYTVSADAVADDDEIEVPATFAMFVSDRLKEFAKDNATNGNNATGMTAESNSEAQMIRAMRGSGPLGELLAMLMGIRS